MEIEFSQPIFDKSSNIKFNEDPYSGSRVVPCGQTDRHNEATVAFLNIANAPENGITRTNLPVLLELQCIWRSDTDSGSQDYLLLVTQEKGFDLVSVRRVLISSY
jgi:hypothetical protein